MVFAQRLGSLLLDRSTVTANSASQDGGVVATETLMATTVIRGSLLQQNTVELGNGGVLDMGIPGPVRLLLKR